MTVLLIVLLHAVPVFLIAAWTGSRIALTIAAIISGVIGVASGNPAYIAADLIGVVIAFLLGLSFTNKKRAPGRIEEPPSVTKEENGDSSWVGVVVGAVILAIFLYNKITDKSAPVATAVQVPQQVGVMPNQEHSDPRPQAKFEKPSSPNRSMAGQDLRDCLNLRSDAEISKCAGQGK